MNRTISRIIVGALALAVTTHAADFYVAPNGSDAEPGTREQPFATPVKARDAIQRRKAEEATDRPCPYCLTEIPKAATRCPSCTSEVAAE